MNAIDRRKVDDMARASLHHGRRDLPGTEAAPQQIHLDHVDIVLHRLLFHRAKAHYARIVHKQIGCLAEGLEGGCNLLRGSDIGFYAHRVFDLGCSLCRALGAQIENADAIAGLTQAAGDVGAQSGGSTGNHCCSHVDPMVYAF